MDTLVRIRLAIWVMVLALWGTLTYQYLGDASPEPRNLMHWVANPFPRPALSPPATPGAQETPAASEKTPPTDARTQLEDDLAKSMPTTPLPAPWAKDKLATAAPPGRFISPLTPKGGASAKQPIRRKPASGSLRRHEYKEEPTESKTQQPKTPEGFIRSETDHFLIFSEGGAAPGTFLQAVENLHSNLMIDLSAFSPWARDERVSIFLFRNQESYRRVTGRPAWSGGASSVSKRKIYLYESDELMGILAHEMCHILFDSFFLSGTTDPLWLSEGMATLVQVERGLSSPNWLPENLDVLFRGGGFKIDDLTRIDNTAGANDDNVRLWYTQSYSIVRFLIRSQWKSAFYRFCTYLRDGTPLQAALYRAYGAPFTSAKALESVWRFDLETHAISRLRTARH